MNSGRAVVIAAREQRSNDGHRDKRTHAARSQGDAGLQGRIAQQRLQPDRQQHHAAVEDESDARHQDHAGAIGPVAKYGQMHYRMLGHQLPNDEGGESGNEDDAQRENKARREPIVLFAFIEHHLQRADTEGQ